MTTLDRMGRFGLFQHRRWEDIALMVLGAAIMVSPMFVDSAGNGNMIIATAIVGAAIVIVAGLEQLALRRWEEFLVLFCGLWVIAAPFALEYAGMLRTWHIVLGAAVAALAVLQLWQDRHPQSRGIARYA